MPTEELKTLTKFFDIKKQGGAVSVLSVFVGAVYLFLRLPPEQIKQLKDVWWLISIPSVLVLVSWMFSAYISEMQSRTSVEKEIQINLSTLVENFKLLFTGQKQDREHYDNRIDKIEDHLKSIYIVLEKRKTDKSP